MSAHSVERLEAQLRTLAADLRNEAARSLRRRRWQAALRYRRSEPMLCGLIPPDLLQAALTDLSAPELTWRLLRCLCRHIRFNSRSPLGSLARLRRCRAAAAGEVLLLARQRAARRDRAFVGGLFESLQAGGRGR